MTTTLYTPQILALATGLAAYRLDDDIVLRTEARSRSCGSSIVLGVLLDENERVVRVGLRNQACAIGQASAAIFAQGAKGRSVADILDTGSAIDHWLKGEGYLPEWPGLEIVAAARDFPGRHGALMLPWTAASQLLSMARSGS